MKQFLLLLSILCAMTKFAHGQINFELGPLLAIDYVKTPEEPKYNSTGYGDQLSFRYGIKSVVSIKNRIKIGFGIEKYSRNECYDCVHFPDVNTLPQRAYQPFVNNYDYECQYKTDTRINFMEFPISISYDVLKINKLSFFTELGYSYQFILGRKISMIDLQSDQTLERVEDQSYLWSRESIRLSVGLTRKILSKMTLNTFIMYRSDSFDFDYQSIGLGLNVLYKI